MLATEACMREIGKRLGIEEEKLVRWAMAGLLHDGDYRNEVPKEKQGVTITEMLRTKGFEIPDDIAHCMAAHNPDTGVEPESKMDWTMFCCDTLTGLIVATALVYPNKKLASVTVESILRKYKSPSFAAGTRREDIAMCEDKLRIPLEEFFKICLEAMQDVADILGL